MKEINYPPANIHRLSREVLSDIAEAANRRPINAAVEDEFK